MKLFKMKNLIYILICFVGLGIAYGCGDNGSSSDNKRIPTNRTDQTEAVRTATQVYKAYCLACHGQNGNANLLGAKDLTKSVLSKEEVKNIIKNGSKNKKMIPYGNVLKPQELDRITDYVMGLRTK